VPPRPSTDSFALVREPEGVLTFAFGPRRYKAQAISLAQSVRLHNPGLRLACITDDMADTELARAFDILIPFVPARGKALQQKLWFDAYTPFERTAFIDSDCLVVGSLDDILKRSGGYAFAPLGYTATEGWWYMKIAEVLKRYQLPFLPRFNGGYYYFERSPQASLLFDRARQVGRIHNRLNIFDLGLWFNEEVFYAFAMAWLRMPPVPDTDRSGMYTPDEFTEPFEIDVLKGVCRFTREGELYQPRIVHFFGRHGLAYQYLRERARLRFYLEKRPSWLSSLQLGLGAVAFRWVVGLYRIVGRLRGRPLPFRTNEPVVSVTNFLGPLTRRIFE